MFRIIRLTDKAYNFFYDIDYCGAIKDNHLMKTSNKFTLSRAIFAPFFFLIYSLPIWTGNSTLAQISAWIMLPLFGLFELTDFFDGYYARKNGDVSDFGKLFDPFADVILNLTMFICIMSSYSKLPGLEHGWLPAWFFVLILIREYTMNFIRMIATSKGTAIAARKGGKLKTVFYIASGLFAIAIESLLRLDIQFLTDWVTANLCTLKIIMLVMFCICILLSYISFIDYIVHFAKVLKKEDK